MAFDPVRRTLLVANVGDPEDATSHTLSIVDTDRAVWQVDPVAGRTRWAMIFDPAADQFFINVADPPSIVVAGRWRPDAHLGRIEILSPGPHGLDLDDLAGSIAPAMRGACSSSKPPSMRSLPTWPCRRARCIFRRHCPPTPLRGHR
jgi:hypothetical protein